jgi:hypothetical protein
MLEDCGKFSITHAEKELEDLEKDSINQKWF